VKRSSVGFKAELDESRQRFFLWLSCLFWALVLAVLVLRDPFWRILHREKLVSSVPQAASGWVQLDKRLVERLSKANVEPVTSLDSLEKAIADALQSRRAVEGSGQGTVRSPIVVSQRLRDLARARAARRLEMEATKEIAEPELLYPELHLSLLTPGRLIRSEDVFQRLPAAKPPTASLGGELVSGWMNRLGFGSLVRDGLKLEVGVGVIPSPRGGGVAEVLLVETVADLDRPLPAVVKQGGAVEVAGRCMDGEKIDLFFKRPADPGFSPLKGGCSGNQFSFRLTWDGGPGGYSLRMSRGERLSDPRPVFVE
jgi:hypothetical protein